MFIRDKDRVLFQGDSITDCGRDKEDSSHLGFGYVNMIAAWYAAIYPQNEVTFLNKGVSGDRAKDLVQRLNPDCIALEPSLVSILVGINDCLRRYDSNDPTSMEEYATHYRLLLQQTKEKTDARILLLEPFLLPYPADRKNFREDLDPKIQVVRSLAREFQATLVPLDGIFHAACTYKTPSFWAYDGVHPSPAGHALIAKEWLKATTPLRF